MATFDIEYMFLMTRAQSVGSKIPMTVTCPDDGETKVEHEINIDEIKVKKTDGHTNVIMLTDDIGITMKYPNLDMVKKFTNTANITEVSFEMIKSSSISPSDISVQNSTLFSNCLPIFNLGEGIRCLSISLFLQTLEVLLRKLLKKIHNHSLEENERYHNNLFPHRHNQV